jgi:signal transduction histidine kinase
VTFRSRLILGFAALAAVPLVVLSFGVRRELGNRLTVQYRERVAGLVEIIAADLERQSAAVAARLAGLAAALADDDRFRLGALRGAAAERGYVLEYATRALPLTGLAVLQIQDDAGRILSSGHFRNEFDRLDRETLTGLAAAGARATLLRARTPTGPVLALARLDSVALGGRTFFLVGGTAVDEVWLRGFSREPAVGLLLHLPDTTLGPAGPGDTADALVETLAVPLVDPAGAVVAATARLVVAAPLAPLLALRRGVDRWFLAALGVTVAMALALALALAARMSRPIYDLARAAQTVDLERGPVALASERTDEVGVLARVLERMVARLRSDAARLRDVERRATLGDLARQVNHDIRNGLTPIRNVFRHLAQVAEREPASLPAVFEERRATVESGVAYLERLAGNYARLHPELDLRDCDLAALVREVADTVAPGGGTIEVDAATPVSARTDPLLARRILENLTRNAVEAATPAGGRVRLAAEAVPAGARLTVRDTGPGMTQDQLDRAFEPFHTTKAVGTGLGLPIVRRLVTDLGGTLRVETAPGRGTTFIVELPAETPRSTEP